ncbi:hypothetical protein K438DRAFT_1780207 [Mycena galopus ATCC 62051]|nr:hypothetical protein K438DRAFT_1780207 [Mycena galopus ATCC 62051]
MPSKAETMLIRLEFKSGFIIEAELLRFYFDMHLDQGLTCASYYPITSLSFTAGSVPLLPSQTLQSASRPFTHNKHSLAPVCPPIREGNRLERLDIWNVWILVLQYGPRFVASFVLQKVKYPDRVSIEIIRKNGTGLFHCVRCQAGEKTAGEIRRHANKCFKVADQTLPEDPDQPAEGGEPYADPTVQGQEGLFDVRGLLVKRRTPTK